MFGRKIQKQKKKEIKKTEFSSEAKIDEVNLGNDGFRDRGGDHERAEGVFEEKEIKIFYMQNPYKIKNQLFTLNLYGFYI